MESIDLIELLTDKALLFSLAALRVTVAFLLMPLFTKEGVPAMVRNSLYFSLALLSILVQPAVLLEEYTTEILIGLFAKELIIGIVVGFFFGLFLWAFEAAGVIIDMQVGASFALFFDPIVGNEVTLIGTLLTRWAAFVFLASGGLMLMTGVLLESFAIWPLLEPVGGLRAASAALFQAEMSRSMSLAMQVAGPVMAVIFLIDIAMGILNRFAQQFNVFFLSMSIKSIAALMLLIVMLPFLVNVLVDELQSKFSLVPQFLRILFDGNT